MVAKITMPLNITRALNYNEKKVSQGQAEFIYAGNFLKDAEQLTFHDKLNHFKKLIDLNERTKTNTLHISLNFDPSEKLNKQTLVQIAFSYMEKIGFGKQPYLVYEHHDAGHPHIHLVTTNIKSDGSRILIHNIGRNQSSKARVEIEQEFGLVKATRRKQEHQQKLQPVNTQKVLYGKSETKQSITNVLDAVLNSYKYTSLNQLNAVLQLYNVKAELGDKDGHIFKNKGLIYRILDEKGNAVGVPVKASSIYSKPTLSYLEGKFFENKQKRQPHEKRLKTMIDWTLAKRPESLNNFIFALEKEKVNTIVRKNEQGFVYGLTFIDHQTKSVFNGSDLGKSYSAKLVLERCGQQQKKLPALTPRKKPIESGNKADLPRQKNTLAPNHITPDIFIKMVEAIVKPEEQHGQAVAPQRRKKRKKKKRLSTH
jgi:hypothetical protein